MRSYLDSSYTIESYEIDSITILPVLVSTDLKIKLSGGAANSDFNASLGGTRSSVDVVNNVNNNVFDDISSGEHTSGDTEYRCVYLYNNDSTTTMKNIKIYISSDSSSTDDEWDIGLGTSGLNSIEQTIADESTEPIDITFSHPTSESLGLSPADIPVGQHYPLWFRRTIDPGSSTFTDTSISLSYVFDER